MSKKTTVKKHYRKTKKGKVPVKQHKRKTKGKKNRGAIPKTCTKCGKQYYGPKYSSQTTMCRTCTIKSLKNMGAAFGIDQFGTGQLGAEIIQQQRRRDIEQFKQRDAEDELNKLLKREKKKIGKLGDISEEVSPGVELTERLQQSELFRELESGAKTLSDMKALREAERIQQKQLDELLNKQKRDIRGLKRRETISKIGRGIKQAGREWEMKREGERFLKKEKAIKKAKEIKVPEFKTSKKATEGFKAMFGDK